MQDKTHIYSILRHMKYNTPDNPQNWKADQIKAWAMANSVDFTEPADKAEIRRLQVVAIRRYCITKAREARTTAAQAGMMFRAGKSIEQIMDTTGAERYMVTKWINILQQKAARLEVAEYRQPHPSAVEIQRISGDLPEEIRLLELNGEAWLRASDEDKKKSFDIQLLAHGKKVLEHLRRQNREELIEAQSIKAFVSLLTAKEKLCPAPAVEPARTPGSALALMLVNGTPQLPPRAKAREIEA